MKNIQVGEVIFFVRNGRKIKGTVFKKYENSVCVDISAKGQKFLELATPRTVVSYKHINVDHEILLDPQKVKGIVGNVNVIVARLQRS